MNRRSRRGFDARKLLTVIEKRRLRRLRRFRSANSSRWRGRLPPDRPAAKDVPPEIDALDALDALDAIPFSSVG